MTAEAAAARNMTRFRELPGSLARDIQLQSNLELRYGPFLKRLAFREIELPVERLARYRVDDFHGYFECLIESDREYDAVMLLSGEEPEWPWEDAEERYAIALEYVSAFRAGAAVLPIVVDLERMADLGMVEVIDGHHRVLAAHEAAACTIAAYEVVAPDRHSRSRRFSVSQTVSRPQQI